jgi:glutaredoxin-related protein
MSLASLVGTRGPCRRWKHATHNASFAAPKEIAMPRPILAESNIHPAIREKIATHEQAIVREVQAAVAKHAVVVVGMGLNPFPKKARKALDAAGVAHHYLEYGNYFNNWRQRNALKLWTGWPTFPMVFVKGILVGGADDLIKLIDSGELTKLLA